MIFTLPVTMVMSPNGMPKLVHILISIICYNKTEFYEITHVLGVNDRIGGSGHGNQINGLVCTAENVYSSGIDDTLRKAVHKTGPEAGAYENVTVALGSQPRAMDIYKEKSLIIVVTVKEVSPFNFKYLWNF